MTTQPLQGLRVLEISTVVMGPYSAQILGDYGAEVIKLESAGGDVLRYSGPSVTAGLSSSFSLLNRNKRSIAIDLKHPDAAEILIKLIQSVDVLIHNMRAGPAQRLGLDYESLRKVNERLIYVHLTGFDSSGPYAGNPAYEDLIQSTSGVASLAAKVGEGSEPALMPTLIADKVTGLHAVGAVLAAAYERERTNQGCSIEVPMLETVASFLLVEHFGAGMWSASGEATGYDRMLNDRMRPFKTKDGYIGLLPYSDEDWRNLFPVLGYSELVDDPRLETHNSRVAALPELYDLIHEATPARSTEEWLSVFKKANVPAARYNSLESLPSDPHLKQVDFFVQRASENQGRYTDVRSPIKFEGEVPGVRYEPPLLGQHTEEILDDIGFNQHDIEELLSNNVVFRPVKKKHS